MTPQALKSAILQLAIQGKLVPQRPEDGVARVPAALNTEKKKARRHEEEIEPPFDIPESWRWVRFGNAITLLSGTDFPPEQYNNRGLGIPYITGASSLSETGVFVNRWTESPRILAKRGDILLVCKGSGYGKTVVCDIDEAHIARQIMAVQQTSLLDMKYVRYFLMASFQVLKSKGQGVIPGIDRKSVLQMLFPLPPLPEQHRIVAKIEELLPLIDRYEQAWTKLEDFNRRFPADLQKSLLQMAIQGHLVDQRPEEGTTKVLAALNTEKKKARRHGEEIEPPFDIPESWRWVRLGEVADVQLGKMLDKGKNKGTPHPYLANVSVRWRSFDLSELRIMLFTEPECEKFALLPGDVLMCEGGVPGRCAVWRQEHSPIKYQKAVHRIRSTVLFSEFIQLYFEAIVDNSWFAEQFTGTTIKHLPRERLLQTPIPLPPLAEQKRIVAKLEELLPLCERLQ